MTDKIDIDAIYNLGDWKIKILKIEEPSSPEFIEQQKIAPKPKRIWEFRRVFYSKIGDAGEPFWLNEELMKSLAKLPDNPIK